MRAMTLAALCMFLDITDQTWRDWRSDRPDLLGVITRAEAVIYRQKFEGASADMLNANIIARDLGLSDRRELTGKDGGPIQTEDVTRDADDFTRRIVRLTAGGDTGGGTGETNPGGEG